MAANDLTGRVQTVLGPIDPTDLGITQTHEHLLTDTGCYFKMPEEASEREWVDAPLTIERRGGIGPRFNYNRDNTRLYDIERAIEEVLRYKHAGGQSLVDTSSIGLARDPLGLARISRATGLNIIMGGSHYVPVSYPADMDKRSESQIAENIIHDITVGVGDTGVKSGVIGEVGNFWPQSANERKVLRASAYAQRQTGALITIHPGYHVDSPPAIMRDLIDAGAWADHIAMGHLDAFNDKGMLKEVASTGCYMQWDLFGFEDTSVGAVAHQAVEWLSDVQRIEMIEFMIERGLGDRILVAHDVCLKFHYTQYGGKGYAHILENIVPRMRKRGFTEQQLHAILVDNPARALAFRSPDGKATKKTQTAKARKG